MIEHVNVGAVPHQPFSAAVVVDKLVFVSGQASVDAETGAVVSDTFEGEMRRSFANLRRVLEAVNCRLDHLVSVRCYVDAQVRLEEFNRLYRELVPSPYPARTTLIGVFGNDFLKFEVDAVAYRAER